MNPLDLINTTTRTGDFVFTDKFYFPTNNILLDISQIIYQLNLYLYTYINTTYLHIKYDYY